MNTAYLFATLTGWDQRRHQKDIVREIFPKLLSIPGAKVIAINPPSLGGSRFTPGIQFVISGSNYDDIYSWANIILDKSLFLADKKF